MDTNVTQALFTLPFIGAVEFKHLMAIGYLIIIEGLLSFDNALALAALVKKRLPDPKDQKKALTYGIWGAYLFRTLVVFIGVWLMKFMWVQFAAGGYLVYLAIRELFFEDHPLAEGEAEAMNMKAKWLSPLWSTILAVELMDIMFSIDSVGVALAVSDVPWVLVTGAMLGILAMRFAAGAFVKLIDVFPILEKTAFVLVGIAGANILLKIFGIHIPEMPFLAGMLAILVGAMAFDKLVLQKRAAA